jgi:uncharacterized membrane protein YeaQ/YmgE (transglycosylase-associated protein family)
MKLCSILFTIGWLGALTFGWLALAAPITEPAGTLMTNMLLAVVGAAMGLTAWIKLKRDY